jgi:uncharacterized protein
MLVNIRILAVLAAISCIAVSAHSEPTPPAAIFTDPAPNKFPARSEVLHIPSGGVLINGLAYIPPGVSPHPTVILLHGLPGNEKNLDLAQAMRRAGWVVVTFNYRGSWGSPGDFSFKGNLEDAKAVLAYVRNPQVVARLRIDPSHLVLMGHSMGGWVTAVTAAKDPGLAGVVLISAADMSRLRLAPNDIRLRTARENMETLAGVTAESLAAQFLDLGAEHSFAAAAPGLATKPLLVLSADDGLAPGTDALVDEVRSHGDHQVTAVHVATDHSWNGDRIRLESEIMTWLQGMLGAAR